MRNRRKMRVGDWLNGFTILVVGVFIGLALDNLFQLSGAAFWISAIGTPILIGGVFIFGSFFDKLIDRLFPSGFKKSGHPKIKDRKPFALLLSLPVGIVIGIFSAQFGLGDVLL